MQVGFLPDRRAADRRGQHDFAGVRLVIEFDRQRVGPDDEPRLRFVPADFSSGHERTEGPDPVVEVQGGGQGHGEK